MFVRMFAEHCPVRVHLLHDSQLAIVNLSIVLAMRVRIVTLNDAILRSGSWLERVAIF